jgi:glutaredoxin 3
VPSDPPPIDLDWSGSPARASDPAKAASALTVHTESPQPPALQTSARHGVAGEPEAKTYAQHSRQPAQPHQSVAPTTPGFGPSGAPNAGAAAIHSSGRTRCNVHHIFIDDSGRCPRCQPSQPASANWVYALLLGTAVAIFMLFVATRAYRALRDFAETQATLGPASGALADTRVVVYTTKTCPACRQAKTWMNVNQIAYTERIVDSDDAAAAEFMKFKSHVVPTFLIDGEVIPGFSEARIQAKLRTPQATP